MSRDRLLLKRAQNFEPETLKVLRNQFHESVYRYFYSRIGVEESCRDLTSELFVRMLEKLKQGKGWRTTPGAWIFGIARNMVADHYRQQYKQKAVVYLGQPELPVEEDPVRQMLINEKRASLLQAIGTLTDEQQDVVLLRFMEGLSVREVSEVLEKTPGAVKGLQYRALRALAARVKPTAAERILEGVQ